ncbi:uncharacterized protein LOC106051671 isoform X2 [Biomphalaria glabrata]|uniref:Uncharacterized protein LOC106051671 isoform X2 n=1 Tax=Biomphalaria glabrata TaxID=6526 RepID=A0A9W2ZXC1_BIOGL|nr:uncharacterized protein LOC106051671 isoform X2 [Biomphalaria glabrata]
MVVTSCLSNLQMLVFVVCDYLPLFRLCSINSTLGKSIVLSSWAQTDDHDCDLDLEEILNLDEDNERRKYIMQCLQDAKQSPEEIHNFAEELLRRAKTL